jgi:hypothetical protein
VITRTQYIYVDKTGRTIKDEARIDLPAPTSGELIIGADGNRHVVITILGAKDEDTLEVLVDPAPEE